MWRIPLAILLLLTSLVAAIVAAFVIGRGYAGVVTSFACLIAGFLSLGITRRAHAMATPLRLSVALCSLILILTLFGLQWPPVRSDLDMWVTAVGMLALSAAGVVVLRRSRRAALTLLALPAVNALWTLFRLADVLHTQSIEALGPSVTLASYIVVMMAAGWVVAPWHAWRGGTAAENQERIDITPTAAPLASEGASVAG